MDGNDLRKQILGLEVQIEELAETAESCQKIILATKAIIAVGGILILAIAIGMVRFDSMVMIGAIAAFIGGTVVFGSNTSTLKQTMAAMKTSEALRAELISRIDLRVVEDGKVES
jgi:hypothetical protein